MLGVIGESFTSCVQFIGLGDRLDSAPGRVLGAVGGNGHAFAPSGMFSPRGIKSVTSLLIGSTN